MPQILLTPEEKGRVRANILGTTNVIDFAREVSDGTAQAQLKKVAEWLKNLPTDGHDKWYWYHQDLAEQLLKECE